MRTALVHSDAYGRFDYGSNHPLRMERLGLTFALMEAFGLTALPETKVLAPGPAPDDVLRSFHTEDYLEVLRRASAGQPAPEASRYGLGPGDNPIWPGMYEASALACGGSIQAAELVAAGEVDRAFAFAGGLHHAMPDRASGFCYLNDAVLAIQALRARGLRVAYVDIDAHHGDGVQAAFYESPDVLTISTHERGDRLFPGTGFVEEIGAGPGRGYAVNVPLQPYTDDAVYLEAFDAVVPPVVRAYRPDVVVAQLGIDSHRTDPLTHLALSVDGFAEAVRRILHLAPRLVALGGGGYDLANVARAWTIAWALMNEVALPDRLPPAFVASARRHLGGRTGLWDRPEPLPPEVVRAAREFAARQIAALERLGFPVLGA
ncbi:MAG TPA: acetoin utilization protein AcuC [Methylomirabilota bacterium]|jgi:acetoin utilization protein AcuC|nr:acetoin utilization protein AcuC [Methylomirabilota bacterium]